MEYEMLTIKRKARKYFHTTDNRYLVINEVSKIFKNGDRVAVQVNNLTKVSKHGVRFIYEPIIDLTQMTYEQAIAIINADRRAYRIFSNDDLREAIEHIEYKKAIEIAIDEKEWLSGLIVDNQETLHGLSF